MSVEIDPISVEVIANNFHFITEEMGISMVKSSYSTNIKERRDCSAVLLDSQGRTIDLTAYTGGHIGSVLGLLEAGAAGYLLKSSRGRDVVTAIRAVKEGESVLHPSIIAKLLERAIGMPVANSGTRERDVLTDREMEALRLAATGMSNKEIAEELCVTIRTVKAHLSSVFVKMNVASRTEAILEAVRQGWLDLEDAPPDAGSS